MSRTPDRHPGPLIEDDEIRLGEVTVDPSIPGAVVYRDGAFKMRDAVGNFDPRTGGGGLTPTTHRALDQLVHDLAENSYTETEKTGKRVTAVRTYTNVGKTEKIREEEYTYTGRKVTTIVTKQYASGVLAETYTETITYSGATVDTITGVLS